LISINFQRLYSQWTPKTELKTLKTYKIRLLPMWHLGTYLPWDSPINLNIPSDLLLALSSLMWTIKYFIA